MNHRPASMRHLIAGLIAVVVSLTMPVHAALETIQSGYGILFFNSVPADFESLLHQTARQDFPELRFTAPASDGTIATSLEWVPVEKFPLPKSQSFDLFSVGMQPGDRERILASKQLIYLSFIYPADKAIVANHIISRYIGAVVSAKPAAVWDDETRQVLSATEWIKRRVDSWRNDDIDIRQHITMHEYRDPVLRRIITLGMRKFALPDLVLEGVPGETSTQAGNTINYVSQFYAESGYLGGKALELDLHKLRNPEVRGHALRNPGDGAKGSVRLRLNATPPEQGDPDNHLLKIDFPECAGSDDSEKLASGMAALYGTFKSVLYARNGDVELIQARDRARHLFLEKRSLFKAGLKPGERLLVKHGFAQGKDTEYMWVELYAWEGNQLSGIVINNSQLIEDIKAGKRIQFLETEIYDYLIYFSDGSEEGNETGKILEARQGRDAGH